MAESLQNESIQMVNARALVLSACDELQKARDLSDEWNGIWERTLTLCKKHNIEFENDVSPSEGIRLKRPRKLPSAFHDYVVEAPVEEHTEILDSSYQYKTKVFFVILDRMQEELKRRFSAVNDVVYNGIDAPGPMSKQFFNQKVLQKFALHYKTILFDNTTDDEGNELKLNNEIVAAKFLLDDKLKKMQKEDKSVSLSTVDIYTELQKFGAFKTLELLLQISMTLPVTTASCERSFSCLN